MPLLTNEEGVVSQKSFHVEPFEPKSASKALWGAYFNFDRSLFKETCPDPDEEPISSKIIKRFMADPGPFQQHVYWMVLGEDKAQMIGFGQVSFVLEKAPNYEENKHIASCAVRVARGYRNRGLGAQLLQAIVGQALNKNVTLLQTNTSHEAGHAFCKHFGGEAAIEGAENRLQLADVDWDMIEAWQQEGPKRAPGVRVEDFESVPEASIAPYTELYTETMNQQPMGELENKMITTPQSRRVQEQEMKKKGITWLTKVTREKSGAISGLTEVLHAEEEPHKVFQQLTGVGEAFRGRGLGKWLKADMLLHVRDRYPEVRCIVTGNADVNAPMLSINTRMGFKTFLNNTVYQVQLNDLCQKLRR